MSLKPDKTPVPLIEPIPRGFAKSGALEVEALERIVDELFEEYVEAPKYLTVDVTASGTIAPGWWPGHWLPHWNPIKVQEDDMPDTIPCPPLAPASGKCTCGGEASGAGTHSDWCDKV